MAWQFSENAEEFDISILHSREKSVVALTEEDLMQLLSREEEYELAHAIFNIRGRLTWRHRDKEGLPIHDSRLGEIWVIMHYKPSPKPTKRQILSSFWSFEKKCFAEWLGQFKGDTCNLELLDYLRPWSTRKKPKDLSSESLSEVRRLKKLYWEFSEKRHKYEEIYLEAFARMHG